MLSRDRIPSRKALTKLICVLDIDETLVHSTSDMEAWKRLRIFSDPKKMDLRSRHYVLDLESERGSGIGVNMWGTKRPYLEEFIRFCFEYFKIVIVWSAGVYDYVHAVVEEIFKDSQEPHAILTRGNCTGNTYKLEKPFWKMIKDVPGLEEYIEYDRGMHTNNIKNVFIVDDRRSSFAQNPDNGICIPVYEPIATEDGLRRDDVCLLQLMKWLMLPEVMNSQDVRTLDKNIIFGVHVDIPMRTGHSIKADYSNLLHHSVKVS